MPLYIWNPTPLAPFAIVFFSIFPLSSQTPRTTLKVTGLVVTLYILSQFNTRFVEPDLVLLTVSISFNVVSGILISYRGNEN